MADGNGVLSLLVHDYVDSLLHIGTLHRVRSNTQINLYRVEQSLFIVALFFPYGGIWEERLPLSTASMSWFGGVMGNGKMGNGIWIWRWSGLMVKNQGGL